MKIPQASEYKSVATVNRVLVGFPWQEGLTSLRANILGEGQL